MKSSVLRTFQIEHNRKPNPCWNHAMPITVFIVGNHGLGAGMKKLGGEMKSYIKAHADFIALTSS